MVAMTKKAKTFQITLMDSGKSFYCGGEKVCGRIEVEVSEVTRVSTMKVLALGCAKVEYAKGKQRCRQEAEYLRYEEVLQLSEQPTSDGSVVLRPGNKYEYTFGFDLPQQQLVSSYKGKFGYVHYYIKALMERPQLPTLECKRYFEVEEPLDVNTPDLLIYVHIPGSEKLILELPLVIGTAGLGSRSNSVSSQEGSVSNASQSWVSLRMPSEPPSYCDITKDCRLDQPLTPLLDDVDCDDSPIFMNAPSFQFPSPPEYTETEEEYNGNS
uniref:Thioredoxin interacting protein a n=1 Tax=Fundulus heteroclitus TaxID=8078 RepID=A0A3Q2QET5_FUNHE